MAHTFNELENPEIMRFSPYRRLSSLQAQVVGDHRDELAVGRLALHFADGVAEKSLQGLHVASVSRNLDGVADGAFHSGRRCPEFLRDLRI